MFLFRSSAEPQSRPTTAAEAGVSRVVSAIQAAAQKTGAGFDYLLRTARRESSLQPTAQAPTSSARGLYQFIDSTWLTMVRDEGRNLGLGSYAEKIGRDASGRPTVADPATRQEILALRDDPSVAALMAGAFTNRNAADLRAATGRDPTEGELYMAHFLGSGGAARLINSNQTNPQASAALLFPDAAGANRRIFFDRIIQSRDHFQGRADVVAHFLGQGGFFQVAPHHVFQLLVHVDGVQQASRGQAFGQADSRIAGIGADLQDLHGLDHLGDHGQEAALHLARQHAGLHHLAVGFPVELV